MSRSTLPDEELSESSRLSGVESHVYTIGKLLAATFSPIEEIIEGMFVAGRSCVIGGSYGVGKTTLSIQLGVGLAAGEPVFGRKVARAYRVGYFDLELGAAEFQGRLRLARSGIHNTANCDENFVYVDASTEGDLFGKIKLQPENDGWLLAELIRGHNLEIVIVDNLSLAVPGDLSDPKVCMELHRNLGRLRRQAPTLRLPILPAHLVKPSRGKEVPPSLLKDPRGWLAGIRGSGKLLDHITQRFGFDEEKDGDGNEYHVLNGISSHRRVSPLVLEQDMETRQFHVSTDRSMNRSVIFTPAERSVWDGLSPRFKYGEVKKHGGSGYRMFEKAKEHGLIIEIEPNVWKRTLDG
jgi:AAA domain